MNYESNPHVLRWIEMVESGEIPACLEQHKMVALVRRCFETEPIYTDAEQLEKYLGLIKYFPYDRIFSWEEFCLALHLTTYWKDSGQPRWPDMLILCGRGAGKDGYIALESFAATSPYNSIHEYDVDICANAEEQAMRPVNDILAVLEDARYRAKLKKHFYWTKEKITGLKYRGTIRGRTNNPKSKDGMRSGMVVFNEIHQYENYDNIKVFVTGLGKKKHPRRLYATTNGDVRGGPLDDLLERSEQILDGVIPDNGFLPFICRLDDNKEADNPEMWTKANPSLPYLPDLMTTIRKEYLDWKQNPVANADFMTKRMNRPEGNREIQVTSWENIQATNREIPDLAGSVGVAGIDYASLSDFAAAGILVKRNGIRYWITHSWMCVRSVNVPRLKIPWREWAQLGYLTVVDDVEINPDLIVQWLEEQGRKYNILVLVLDNFRYALVANGLRGIGFDAKEYKNIKLIRPSDLMKVSPVIESAFNNHQIIWGDNPLMRWYTNNTKMIRTGINATTGNMTYGKIEPKSRKTDGFMAFVAAMTQEEALGDDLPAQDIDMPVFTF